MSFGNSNSASYTCTALVGTNKAGVLTPDSDGYYEMVVGGLDAFNSNGAHYPLGPAKHLFESSSSFMRRVAEGNCKGEAGHPKPTPGMSSRDFIGRVLYIEETKVCCHFKSFRLQEEGIKDKSGRPIVAIIAKLKPSGPMGPALKEALENPHENVCFSIRSLTNDITLPNGILQKNIRTIVTFDWVTEGGIWNAQKYKSPSLEAFDEVSFNKEQFESVKKFQEESKVSVEHNGLDIDSIMEDFGWAKGKVLVPNGNISLPPSFNW